MGILKDYDELPWSHPLRRMAAYNVAHLPNPFSRVKQFRPDTRVVRYLTQEERERLIEEAQYSPRYFQEILLVAIETGLRQREVFRLRRDEVDFEKRIIKVRQKGNRLHIVPLTVRVMGILKDLPENGPYFWSNPKTGKPYTTLKNSWKKLKKRAGITRAFRWHDLRHDFLSRIVTTTGSLRIAQELAGHSDPRLTERYAHLIGEGVQNAIQAISDTLVTPTPKDHETLIKTGA